MPNKTTEQMIEEALKEFDSEFHIQTVETNEFGITHIFPLDDEGRMFVPDVSDLKGFIRAKLHLIASKSAEEERERVFGAIDVHADRVIEQIELQSTLNAGDAVDLTSKALQISKVKQGLDNIKKSISEILSQPKENHD